MLISGPGAFVPASVCALLEHELDVTRLRVAMRGRNPEVDAALMAMHQAALIWRERVASNRGGSAIDAASEVAGRSECDRNRADTAWTARQVADRVGVSSRAVRLAASDGRLIGRHTDAGWQFSPDDVAAWAATRK